MLKNAVIYPCPQEDAGMLFEVLAENNFCWGSGRNLFEEGFNRHLYGDDTCYIIRPSRADGTLYFGNVSNYLDDEHMEYPRSRYKITVDRYFELCGISLHNNSFDSANETEVLSLLGLE